MQKVGLGGSCHWCTEAIFQSLKGVQKVEQGWIADVGNAGTFSEAVIVHFDPDQITLETLIAVHLQTHSCTSMHSMRSKYRSAVYTFSPAQEALSRSAIRNLQPDFNAPIITEVVPFGTFRLNSENYLDYYYNNPDKPFCETFINPKLRLLLQQFRKEVDTEKLRHLAADKV